MNEPDLRSDAPPTNATAGMDLYEREYHSIRLKIIGLVVVLLLVIWGSVLGYVESTRTVSLAMSRQTTANLARAFEENVRRTVFSIDQALLYMRLEYEAAPARFDAAAALNKAISMHALAVQLSVTDENGILTASSKGLPAQKVDLSDREHIRVHLKSQDDSLFISKAIFGRVSNQWTLQFTRRVRKPDGSLGGVMVLSVDPFVLSNFYSTIDIGAHGVVTVIGRDGFVRARSIISEEIINTPLAGGALFTALQKSNEGTYLTDGAVDPEKRVASYRALQDYPLVVLVGQSLKVVLANYFEQLNLGVAICTFSTLLMIWFAWLLLRRFSENSIRLLDLTAEVGKQMAVAAAAERSAELAHEIYRTRQLLSEAHRIARLGYVEFDARSGTWLMGDGTREMLELQQDRSHWQTEDLFANLHPDDRAQLNAALKTSGTTNLKLELRVGGRVLQALGEQAGDQTAEEAPRLITFQDITTRRAAEQERARMIERMSEASRLESLGTLAGGVAHEINTPTQYIGDNLSFIKDWLPRLLEIVKDARTAAANGEWSSAGDTVRTIKYDFAARELPAAAEQALAGIRRIASIVQAIKEFAYPSAKTRHLFDINRTAEVACTVTRNQWKHVAELNLELAQDLPQINGIEGEISQVLVNLIVNAAQAITELASQEPGRIDVRTKSLGSSLVIEVADSGPGIARENLDRLFEMFFTTKPPGQGTGQGLAISKAIVLRHGGTIDVTSEPGKGACFRVSLPLGFNETADGDP